MHPLKTLFLFVTFDWWKSEDHRKSKSLNTQEGAIYFLITTLNLFLVIFMFYRFWDPLMKCFTGN